MPSGMTADIYEGKDVSLRDYLMTVGRGMGFAILQRDDDSSEPVKVTEAEADTRYHDGCLRDAKAQQFLNAVLAAAGLSDAALRAAGRRR